jgi:hypothetical protein
LKMLERYDMKMSCTVLRRERESNLPDLFDYIFYFNIQSFKYLFIIIIHYKNEIEVKISLGTCHRREINGKNGSNLREHSSFNYRSPVEIWNSSGVSLGVTAGCLWT